MFAVTNPRKTDFSNIARMAHIEELAKADVQSVVVEVQEYFGDFYAVNRDTFTYNIDKMIAEPRHSLEAGKFERMTEGLVALLLALKKKPVIRYESNSDQARKLAKEVHVRGEPIKGKRV